MINDNINNDNINEFIKLKINYLNKQINELKDLLDDENENENENKELNEIFIDPIKNEEKEKIKKIKLKEFYNNYSQDKDFNYYINFEKLCDILNNINKNISKINNSIIDFNQKIKNNFFLNESVNEKKYENEIKEEEIKKQKEEEERKKREEEIKKQKEEEERKKKEEEIKKQKEEEEKIENIEKNIQNMQLLTKTNEKINENIQGISSIITEIKNIDKLLKGNITDKNTIEQYILSKKNKIKDLEKKYNTIILYKNQIEEIEFKEKNFNLIKEIEDKLKRFSPLNIPDFEKYKKQVNSYVEDYDTLVDKISVFKMKLNDNETNQKKLNAEIYNFQFYDKLKDIDNNIKKIIEKNKKEEEKLKKEEKRKKEEKLKKEEEEKKRIAKEIQDEIIKTRNEVEKLKEEYINYQKKIMENSNEIFNKNFNISNKNIDFIKSQIYSMIDGLINKIKDKNYNKKEAEKKIFEIYSNYRKKINEGWIDDLDIYKRECLRNMENIIKSQNFDLDLFCIYFYILHKLDDYQKNNWEKIKEEKIGKERFKDIINNYSTNQKEKEKEIADERTLTKLKNRKKRINEYLFNKRFNQNSFNEEINKFKENLDEINKNKDLETNKRKYIEDEVSNLNDEIRINLTDFKKYMEKQLNEGINNKTKNVIEKDVGYINEISDYLINYNINTLENQQKRMQKEYIKKLFNPLQQINLTPEERLEKERVFYEDKYEEKLKQRKKRLNDMLKNKREKTDELIQKKIIIKLINEMEKIENMNVRKIISDNKNEILNILFKNTDENQKINEIKNFLKQKTQI